jgi:hypothetical protein
MSTTIVDVLNTEVDRVNDRKTAIDNAEEERKRIIALTSSATERQRAYNTIYAVIVAMLLGVVIIKMLYRFEFVPDFVLDILIAAVVSVGLIYSLLLYSDIIRRNNMDFSQIDFGDVPTKSQAQLDKEFNDKIESGNLGGIASENDGKCNSAETISYKYCRRKNGSYDWLPVGLENIELDTTQSPPVIRRVVLADPNYVIAGRLTYVAETLSTYPAGQDSFTTLEQNDEASVAPFSSNNLYAKYV